MIIHNQERNVNKNNWAPLHCVAKNSSNNVGELLISKGADINETDINYQITINHF